MQSLRDSIEEIQELFIGKAVAAYAAVNAGRNTDQL